MDDYLDSGVFLKLRFKIRLIRAVGMYMSPATCDISCDVVLDDDISQFDVNVKRSLDRVKSFIEMKQDAIIYAVDNKKIDSLFASSDDLEPLDNDRIQVPFEPVDDMIALVLLRKFNAIGGGHVTFGSMTINANDSNGFETMVFGDPEGYFPEMDEWMPGEYFSAKPWWDRNDSSTYDKAPEEGKENEIPDHIYDLNSCSEPVIETKIIKPEFKPRVIKGDLDG